MGNSADDAEFFQHYGYALTELTRITKSGRLSAVHCSDIPYTKWKDGMIGIKDLSGSIIPCLSGCRTQELEADGRRIYRFW